MSNRTPKKQPNETESAHKPRQRNYRKLVFALILFLAGSWAIYSGVSSLLDNERRMLTPKGFITVEVVDTPELRRQGLSGRESLADDRGMLFVFDEPSTTHCLVMRDMLISLDMVWLNENREVITIKRNATPESYPDEVFCPTEPAKYALEIPENRASSLEITEGEQLRW